MSLKYTIELRLSQMAAPLEGKAEWLRTLRQHTGLVFLACGGFFTTQSSFNDLRNTFNRLQYVVMTHWGMGPPMSMYS
jgi:hypothetical protein